MASESFITGLGSASRPMVVRRTWLWALVALLAAWTYYAGLLALGGGFLLPVPHGLTFNSMLSHLLQGRFDVDPETIGDEGTLRNGLTYTYFGIVPALLRAPLLLSRDFAATDVTRLSCWAAVATMGTFKLASALTVWRARDETQQHMVLLTSLIAAILFGGAQIQFLRALIYQEVILWAGAFAAAFVYFALRLYASGEATAAIWTGLAVSAGLALLTRVSVGLGLYAGCGLLWVRQACVAWQDRHGPAKTRGKLRRLVVPAVILAGFAAVAGAVNYGRWGNPLSFTDPAGYLWPLLHAPDRVQRATEYGNFNPIRIGYGLIYYFLPVWALRGSDGNLLWSEFQQRTIDSVELPPSSFFVSDPLLIALAGYGIYRLIRRPEGVNRGLALPILVGLSIPPMLILTFISMTFRYRMEFYPLFEFCAFLGFGALLTRRKPAPIRAAASLCVAGILASQILWFAYMLSPFGPASEALHGQDVVSFYRSWF